MDFIENRLVSGQKFRLFNVVDAFSRRGLASEVDTSLPGTRVVQVLNRLAETRGLPEELVLDNGPEFIGRALDQWAHTRGIRLCLIAPGKPVQNAHVESFHGRFRDECLNESWFLTLVDARRIIEAWRQDYTPRGPIAPWLPDARGVRAAKPDGECGKRELEGGEVLDGSCPGG